MKRSPILSVLACAAFLFFVGCNTAVKIPEPAAPKAASLNVVTMHGSPLKICISKRASLPEVTAAQELQKAIRAITVHGADHTAEILTTDKLPEKNCIVIGDLESPLIRGLADELELKHTDDDVISQAVIGRNLILAGSSPRAALYSVYDFMQNQMGVRWLFEGDDGTFYTKGTCTVPADFRRHHTGGFRYRNMGVSSRKGEEPSYFTARNYAHEHDSKFGGERYYGGETIQPYRSDFKEHPEYFAMRDGKRYLPPPEGWSWVINGCWSNQGFTDLCLQRIREGIRQHNANHISLHPADDGRRCECAKCAKLIDPDASSRWFKYNARMLRELKKDFPDCHYSVLAYQEYREVPACDVEEVEFVEYCQYSRCFVHKIGNPACGTNKADFDRLKRWETEKHVPMGVWDYTFDVFQPGYNLPLYDFFADEILDFHKRGFVKLFIEGGPSVGLSRPARYVALQMMWDPLAKTADEVLADYCKVAYGPAWKDMLAFHQECAKAWDAMPAHLTACFNNPGGTAKTYLTPALIELSKKTFADAEKKIGGFKTDDRNTIIAARKKHLKEQYASAVAFEKKTFGDWITLHEKMMKNAVSVTAYQSSFASLAKEPPVAMKPRRKSVKVPKTADCAIGWNDHAILLRIAVETHPDAKTAAVPFKKRKDGKEAYGAESIELFIQVPGSPAYYQFAAGKNGDFYDGEAMNGKWDGNWDFRVIQDPANARKYVYEIEIPFKNFNVRSPGSEPWKMIIIRNAESGFESVGIPYPAHHDIGTGADVTFCTGKRP